MNSRCESAGGDVTYIGWLTEPVKAGVRLKLACAGAAAIRAMTTAMADTNRLAEMPARTMLDRTGCTRSAVPGLR